MELGPVAASQGFRLRHLPTTPSTNDEARLAAEAGDGGDLWIVADRQEAGRGRRGRSWTSPPGNLYASLLLIDPCAPAKAAELGFVAGLALHDAVTAVTEVGPPRIALKWPNDLLADAGKAAGLLLESSRDRAGRAHVIIGIGVNVSSAPTDTPYRAQALRTLAPGTTPQGLFRALADAMAARLAGWRRNGFHTIRDAWLDRAHGIGQPIVVRLVSGERRGLFGGLDQTGRLALRDGDDLIHIDAGDVFFGPVGTAASAGKHV